VSRGNSRFSANVNLGTSTFNQRYSFNTQNFLSNTLNSSINYSRNFPSTPFNLSTSLRHNQNVQTDITKVIPQASLNMNRLQPFKRFFRKQTSLLGQINIAYNGDIQGEITNQKTVASSGGSFKLSDVSRPDTIGFNLANLPELMSTFRPAIRHSIPISTSGTIARYFTFTPSFNYNETWYFERYSYNYLFKDTVNVDTIRGLSRFYNYSSSVSFSTRVFTTAMFKGKVQAIRHLMTPTVSFVYTPDFGNDNFNFFEQTQVNERGDVQKLPRFSGLYGSPTQGRVGSISVSIDNNIEMKIKNRDPEEKPKKVVLLQNLGFSGNYNLAADSFNLSNINVAARTVLFGKLNVNGNLSVDPYTYQFVRLDTASMQVVQNRLSDYAWNTGNGLGNITQASMALSYSFNKKENPAKKSQKGSQEQLDEINNNPNQYVDFSLPWQLSINTNLSYSKQGFNKAQVTNTVNLNGELSLTPKWKVTFTSGYDFTAKNLSYTSFTIFRDLHCWQMNVTWIPFGPRQSYTLDLGVKAAILQDLKLSRRNNWYDNR
ncbi:MAG: LPS-assembly protein LptD, partial [Cytophagales bacterium]